MKIRSLLIATAAMSAMATGAFAQASDSESVDAKVKFITALTLASSGALNYGTWIKPTSAGSMSINTSAERSGGTTAVNDANNAPSVPTFTVTAEGGQAIGLTLEQSGMTTDFGLSNFSVAAVGGGDCSTVSTTAVSLSGTGSKTCAFKVGADLSYPANASGQLTVGQLKATVVYN